MPPQRGEEDWIALFYALRRGGLLLRVQIHKLPGCRDLNGCQSVEKQTP
jgi:hypothetical protein